MSASDMIPAGTHGARDRRDQGRDLAIENNRYRNLSMVDVAADKLERVDAPHAPPPHRGRG